MTERGNWNSLKEEFLMSTYEMQLTLFTKKAIRTLSGD